MSSTKHHPLEKRRVVFTGHSGLGKKSLLTNLCTFIRNATGKSANWYDAEDFDMDAFLPASPRIQREMWCDALYDALEKWEGEKPDYAFLSLHLSYQHFPKTFSPLVWKHQIDHGQSRELKNSLTYFLRERFAPDLLITLIDDIPFVQARIQLSDEYRVSLQELYTWRELETFLTDYVAQEVTHSRPNAITFAKNYPYENSPVVAIRHPPEMFYGLILVPTIPRIYASFPIGSTRTENAYRIEIDAFRKRLHEKFTVFDPLTIDEMPLVELAKETNGEKGDFKELRWPILNSLCNDFGGEVLVDRNEARDLVRASPNKKRGRSILIDQVETRDFRLIQQSDCLVAYRPQHIEVPSEKRSDFSTGTGAEWRFATDNAKPRMLIHDPVDGDLGDLAMRAFRADARNTPHVFVRPNLSNPDNQKLVLDEVMSRLEDEADNLTKMRRKAEG